MAARPGPPGFFRSLPLPSRRESAVLAGVLLITALLVAGAAWHASHRTPPAYEPPVRTDASAATTPAWTTPTTRPPVDRPPVLAFYGDWYVSGTEVGGTGAAGWPAIVSRRIGAEGTSPHAVRDAGYVTASATTGDTFESLAENAPEPAADVTIVFGGRNDFAAAPADITAGATRTFQAIRAAAPQTQLLVLGPVWPEDVVPAELPPVRDAIREAAVASGATFVDPLAEQWLSTRPGTIGADDISPTDEGHVELADRIEALVRRLLTGQPPR